MKKKQNSREQTLYSIGIDMGGTKIESVLFDGKRVVKRFRIATEPERGYVRILANLTTAVRRVRTGTAIPIRGIGLALPGCVHRGTVFGSGTLGAVLHNRRIADDLAKRTKLPVVMENDAKLFALAETRLGAGKGKRHVIGLIIGTGVGAGVVVDGTVLRGALGAAGEIGHAPYEGHDFEFFTAGPAYRRLYLEAGGTDDAMDARRILTLPVNKRDYAVTQARERALDATARLCATLINTFNPEVIVFGGGVSLSLDYTELRRRTKVYTLPNAFAACSLRKHAISDSAGGIGAAVLAREAS
jgi:predicted NBD/HSP70 family sugar kinase